MPCARRRTSTRTGASMSADVEHVGSRRDLRHHAPRRVPARRCLRHRRGQAAHRRAARSARRPLHRGRLAGSQPQGRGVLPAGRRASCASTPRRSSPSARPGGRRARSTTTHAAQPRRGRDVGRLHRGQELGLPRHRHPRDLAGRGRGDGQRQRRVPGRQRPAGAVRRRALLRRLQAQPGVRSPGARGRGREGRDPPRPLRHQRRFAAVRGRADRHRRQGPLP